MDQAKIAALLALRKQLSDTVGDPSSGEGQPGYVPPTNLTSPEEYQQMPPELQDLVAKSTIDESKNGGFRFGNYIRNYDKGLEDSQVADRMARELENQPSAQPERFRKLKSLFQSGK